MLGFKHTLQINSNLSDLIVTTTKTIDCTIPAGTSYRIVDTTVSKEGYTPIGIVGWDNSKLAVDIYSNVRSSTTIRSVAYTPTRAVAPSDLDCSTTVTILWKLDL